MVYVVIFIFVVGQNTVTRSDSCYLRLDPCSFCLIPLLLLSAVLNISVSKRSSRTFHVSLLYKCLSSLLAPASLIPYSVFPSFSVLVLVFLFLSSLPNRFPHPAACSVLPSCSSFTRLLVPGAIFFFWLCMDFFLCTRARGLVLVCSLDVLQAHKEHKRAFPCSHTCLIKTPLIDAVTGESSCPLSSCSHFHIIPLLELDQG